MKLVRSNRTEALADALAERVCAEPLPPAEKEVIVVQSRGMERWLTLALTERLGVWANPWMPFPRVLIEWVLDKLDVGSSDDTRAFNRERLKWTLAELLRESPPRELARYLEGASDDDRLLRLATRVASAFDDYVMYRPSELETWRTGGGEGWQPELWRRVIEKLGQEDLASRVQRGIELLESRTFDSELLPRRLHLFAPETLPPVLMRFFIALGRLVPTVVYSLEPSLEYLGDVASKAERVAGDQDMHDGHPFLIDTGRLARDFQELLHARDAEVAEEEVLVGLPGRETLLRSFQSDILEFASPPARDARSPVAADDCSISLHACTGPMREAQVVYELIRGVLEDEPGIAPEDIVVMTPDLDAYAPAFRAVFGQRGPNRIPFEVHDRRTRDDAPFFEELLTVLEVLDSRFSVLDFVRLLDASSLREEFCFTQDERARITELLAAAGVRWGIDAAHRAELGFPEDPHHTWRAGLDRLFLGFASPAGSVEVFAGVLPRGLPSLADAELLGRLARLCETLFEAQKLAREPRSIEEWVVELGALATRLFSEDDDISPATVTLRAQLDEVRVRANEGGYRGELSLKAFRRELESMLVQATPAQGFLRRGVSFTEVVPLRSVPFRVVCLVGMSEDAFPRQDDRPSFDLTRDTHQLGDRDRRNDDRHSFLQAVLCARERLIITYSAPAASQRTLPNPSPIVWELKETIDRYYVSESGGPLLEPIAHRLHAFDPDYYLGEELPRSFSERYLSMAQALSKPRTRESGVLLRGKAREYQDDLSPRELAAWLWRPIATFIDRVLKARFEREELYEPTGALVQLDRLAASRVGNEALRAELDSDRLGAYLAASPEFPDGSWGELEQRQLRREIEAIERSERALIHGETPTAELFEVVIDGIAIEARLGGLLADRRVVARFTKPGRQAELQAWVEHLLMQSVEGSQPRTTELVLRGERGHPVVVRFAPVTKARAALARLIEVYRTSREAPLPLIERATRELADHLESGEKSAFKKARDAYKKQKKWDPRLSFVFGADSPFDEDEWAAAFKSAAWELYGPLLKHRSEG